MVNTNQLNSSLTKQPRNQHLWIIAGEESGDRRAAELMQALKQQEPALLFHGAGGPQMAGLAETPFENWIATAGVLGLWDVLKRYPYFRKKFSYFLNQIAQQPPAAVILVDYPGFNLRFAHALRKKKIPTKIFYYISPQVWAWNRRRISKMAKILDLMLCIFPFEKPLYESSHLKTTYVGHPLLDSLQSKKIASPRQNNLVGFFPGSREREIKRLFPLMLETAQIISQSNPQIHYEVAAATPEHAQWMREEADKKQVNCFITYGQSHSLMQRATVGIVCSGTATLEAAFFGLPYCLVYKVAWLTFEVGKRLVKINFLGIVNILANRGIVREFIQHFCTPSALADETLRLLNASEIRVRMQNDLQEVINQLGPPGAAQRAAEAILDHLPSRDQCECA